MRQRLGSAIFPLSLLLALSLLTFWLRYATELPAERHDGKHRHDPDYIVTDGTLRKLDETGKLAFTLRAEEIRHYPDDDSTDLSQPIATYLHPSKPPLTMRAVRGHVNRDGKQVDLYENVHIQRDAYAKNAALAANTEQLTILPDDEIAFTKSPVTITHGKSWAKGVGLTVDNRAQTYVLESRAVAEIESKHAKKKP